MMNKEEENWVDVQGFPNYKISDLRKIDHLNNSQEEFKIP